MVKASRLQRFFLEFLTDFNARLDSSIVDYRRDPANEVMGFGSRPSLTFREFFDQAEKKGGPGALLVGIVVQDLSGVPLPVMILGPAYYDDARLRQHPGAREVLELAGSLSAFQAITLLHEMSHIKTGRNHQEMATDLGIFSQN